MFHLHTPLPVVVRAIVIVLRLALGLLAVLIIIPMPLFYVLRGVRGGRLSDRHVGVRAQRPLPKVIGVTAVVVAGTVVILALVLGSIMLPLFALVALGGWARAVVRDHTVERLLSMPDGPAT